MALLCGFVRVNLKHLGFCLRPFSALGIFVFWCLHFCSQDISMHHYFKVGALGNCVCNTLTFFLVLTFALFVREIYLSPIFEDVREEEDSASPYSPLIVTLVATQGALVDLGNILQQIELNRREDKAHGERLLQEHMQQLQQQQKMQLQL